MSKITLTNLVNLQNETTAVNAINSNNAILTSAIDNTISRDGTLPNHMSGNIDMNGFKILNVSAPYSQGEPVRLADLNAQVADLNARIFAMGTFRGSGSLVDALHPSAFGAVGDGITDDSVAIQNWLNAATTTHQYAAFDAGKTYLLNSSVTLALPTGATNFVLEGNGAVIKTGASFPIFALIVQNVNAITRRDELRKITIQHLAFDQFDNVNAIGAIQVVGTPHVTISRCSFLAGSDTGNTPSGNYSAVAFFQRDIFNPDTCCFWSRIVDCDFKAGVAPMPTAIRVQGGHNALNIVGNSINNCTNGILLARPSLGLNANEAVIVNGLKVLENDFEGCTYGVYVLGTNGYSTFQGAIIANNRIESIGTAFLSYEQLTTDVYNEAVLGPNYISSESWTKYFLNPFNISINIRDEVVVKTTINPASIAAGATVAIGSLTLPSALVGDQCWVEANGDLLGIVATGYISGPNTGVIRLTNPTSGAIDLPSMVWTFHSRRNT